MISKPFSFALTRRERLWGHSDKWIPKLIRLKRAGELSKLTLMPLDHSTAEQSNGFKGISVSRLNQHPIKESHQAFIIGQG